MPVASLPFVGRDDELDALDDLFVQASEGKGGVIAVDGVAGVGKTRLLEQAIDAARARWPEALVAECRCSQHSDPLNPSGPFATLLASIHRADKLTKRLAETVRRIVDSTAPDWLAVLPVVGPIASVSAKSIAAAKDAPSPFGASHGLVDSLIHQYASMLEALATEGTQVILVLEDAQWLARPGYELLASMAQAATAAGIALIVTYDPRRLTSETPLAQELSRIELRLGMERLPLRGLAEQSLAAGLRLRYDAEPDQRFLRWLAELCAGNPLVVAHYLDFLERSGDIAAARAPGGALSPRLLATIVDWDAGVALPESQLPPALESMLRLRVDKLEEDDRELLRVASVQGARFDPDLIAALAGRPETEVTRRLRELERTTGLVAFADEDDSQASAGGDLYEFESGLLHSVVYGELRPRERARCHRLLAEALDDVAAGAAQGSWILGQIGRHRLAAGDAQEAARAFLAAAHAAQLDGRLLDAMELSRRARTAADDEQALRARAGLCWLASSEPWWGGVLADDKDVRRLLVATLEDAKAVGDQDIAIGAELAMARYLRERGEQGPAREAMRRALAAAREGGIPEAEFDCLLTLGYAMSSVDLREGRSLLHEAEALYPTAFAVPGDGATNGPLGLLHAYIGVAEFDGGCFGEADRRLREALALLQRSDRKPDVPRILSFLGQLHMATGAFDEAEHCFRQAVEQLATAGAESGLAAYNTALLGKLALERDDQAAAREALSDALRGLTATDSLDFQLLARTYLAELLVREGDAAGAARESEWVIRTAAKAGYPGMLVAGSSLLAAAHLKAGRARDALAVSSRAVRQVDRLGALVLVRSEEIYLRHAQVLQACDEPAAARAFVGRAAQALQAKADSLTDAATRRSFLTAVPLNVAILSASAGLE